VSVHGLCRALAARGHDVHVYTTSVDGARDSDVPYAEPVRIDGVTVHYFRSKHLRRLYRAPDLGRAVRAHVGEFDIVHTHAVFLWPLWAAARAAERAGVPYVVSPRGMLERDLIDRKSALLKGVWIAAIERHNLERASAIHVTSAREADQAAALGLRLPRVTEIPNGVTVDDAGGEVTPAIARVIGGSRYVLFLGRLNWKKGLDRLIGALALVAEARLVIAGHDEDGYRSVVEALAAARGVAGRIVFTGEVGGADKSALLRHATVLVLPSYSENFGNVVIEAMAAGCPVIVSQDVGLASMVARCGVGLAVRGDAGSLAGAIGELLRDEPRRRQMGERGRAVARDEFSWPSVAARMEQLYASLLPHTRAHA
jgi:glycosyltransferase involved in cell wall biosynthesis